MASPRRISVLGDIYNGRGCVPNLPAPPQTRKPPSPEPASMRNFPQILVNMVIDELAERPGPSDKSPREHNDISRYSTVSRQWVERTQRHHFRVLHLNRPGRLEKWRTRIQAHPAGGVSRHVRRLDLRDIPLQGLDDHIRAFTGVKELVLGVYTLKSLSKVESLVLMGSSLVRLEIVGMFTTPYIMASLLAGLPHLRYLYANYLQVDPDNDAPTLPSNIPFFEGAGTFDIRMVDYLPEKLSWIPPTARFRDLRIDACCICSSPAVVDQWFASSGEGLEQLTIREETLCGMCFKLFGSTSFSIPSPDHAVSFQVPFVTPWTFRGAHP